MMRVVKHWNRLAREVANVPALETFRVVTLVWWEVHGGWARGALKLPSKPNAQCPGDDGPFSGARCRAGSPQCRQPPPGPHGRLPGPAQTQRGARPRRTGPAVTSRAV